MNIVEKLLVAAISAAAPKVIEYVLAEYGDQINAKVDEIAARVIDALAAKLPDIGTLDDKLIAAVKGAVDELLERLPFGLGR